MKMRTMATALSLALACAGCKTFNPVTGQQEFDPVKTETVKAVAAPVVASAVRRVTTDENADYLRAGGAVFCAASRSGQLDPVFLIDALEAATVSRQARVDPLVIDAKNLLVALYKINFNDRFRAELPPDKWPKNVADVLCEAIDLGLKDAGRPGVK